MILELKAFDIVVVEGLWYMPHHWLIRWRGIDKAVHCMTILGESGVAYNPIFTGIIMDNIYNYKGRTVSIHRYKGKLPLEQMHQWSKDKFTTSKGYDFFRQWLLGFVCGISTKCLVNDELRWTCAEFPYWLFQSNGCPITEIEEELPMPRLFKYNDHFETIYKGDL